MCNFCSEIFDLDLLYGEFHKEEKKMLQQQERDKRSEWIKKNGDDFIYKNGSELGIFVQTGDSFCEGWLEPIKYCPKCGRLL